MAAYQRKIMGKAGNGCLSITIGWKFEWKFWMQMGKNLVINKIRAYEVVEFDTLKNFKHLAQHMEMVMWKASDIRKHLKYNREIQQKQIYPIY